MSEYTSASSCSLGSEDTYESSLESGSVFEGSFIDDDGESEYSCPTSESTYCSAASSEFTSTMPLTARLVEDAHGNISPLFIFYTPSQVALLLKAMGYRGVLGDEEEEEEEETEREIFELEECTDECVGCNEYDCCVDDCIKREEEGSTFSSTLYDLSANTRKSARLASKKWRS